MRTVQIRFWCGSDVDARPNNITIELEAGSVWAVSITVGGLRDIGLQLGGRARVIALAHRQAKGLLDPLIRRVTRVLIASWENEVQIQYLYSTLFTSDGSA